MLEYISTFIANYGELFIEGCWASLVMTVVSCFLPM